MEMKEKRARYGLTLNELAKGLRGRYSIGALSEIERGFRKVDRYEAQQIESVIESMGPAKMNLGRLNKMFLRVDWMSEPTSSREAMA